MVSFLYCDLETYSPVPIKHGTHRYAEKAEILLFAYALDDGPINVWDRRGGQPMPQDLYDALMDPNVMTVWHNGLMFDNVILAHSGLGLHLPVHRIHDTMTQALAHGLPGGLAKLGEVFGFREDESKLKEGKRYIGLFCVPNKNGERNGPDTHPEDWELFKQYAGRDVVTMRLVKSKLPTWNYPNNPAEMRVVDLDNQMNNHGYLIDTQLVRGAIRAIEMEKLRLAERASELTGGEVQSATKRDVLLAHLLSEYGATLPDLQSSTIERRLQDESLPGALRELLTVRLQSSSASTAKFAALERSVSADGRLRGTQQIFGAARTRRWAGRIFQPQNLPSRNIMEPEWIDLATRAFVDDSADLIFDNLMLAASSVVRSCIVASPGKKLIVADLSNIEGRDAAWISGEQWKIQAFSDFDAGTGHDLYVLAYARAFGVSPEAVLANKKAGGNWRNIGKVMELALQYGGGVGAFVTFSLVYGIDLDDMAQGALSGIPKDIWKETEWMWDWAKKEGKTLDLSETTFRVCDAFKLLWRRANPNISKMWPELQDAFIFAVRNPGVDYPVGEFLRVRRKGAWLRIMLPSGRSLCYISPKVEEVKGRPVLSYMGLNSYTRKWGKIHTYGGKLFENVCQSVARDILADNLTEVKSTGYNVLLTVHDEVVTETPLSSDFSAEGLSGILATAPAWATGIPLAASGFEAQRYRK